MTAHPPGPITRTLFAAPVHLYDWHAGWLLGQRFLRLTHVGRRSGRTYRTVLEVIGTNKATGECLVVAGYGGSADWYRNVQANPAIEVVLGRRRFVPVHRVLDEAEAARVVADYEHRNRWMAPVLRRVLTRLLGWDYDGSDAARGRLVQQLPVLAFRPADDAS